MELEELLTLKGYSYSEIEKDDIPDLSNISVNVNMSIGERIEFFLTSIKNPYCFRVNQTFVEIVYSDDKNCLDDALKTYLRGIRQ